MVIKLFSLYYSFQFNVSNCSQLLIIKKVGKIINSDLNLTIPSQSWIIWFYLLIRFTNTALSEIIKVICL